jgi:hypothetical protein
VATGSCWAKNCQRKKENKEITKIATSSSLWQGLSQAVAGPGTIHKLKNSQLVAACGKGCHRQLPGQERFTKNKIRKIHGW